MMWCANCPFLLNCEDPAQLGGGCDCDGADDFGVDPLEDLTDGDYEEDDYNDCDWPDCGRYGTAG